MSEVNLVIDLINQANPQLSPPLTSSTVTLGPPHHDTDTDPSGYRNTVVTVSANPNSPWWGGVDVFYHRNDLAVLGELSLMSENPITADSILAYLVTDRNAVIGFDDLVSLDIPSLELGDTGVVDLTALINSYGWIGSNTISVLEGLPPQVNPLHVLMNHTLPSPGYLT